MESADYSGVVSLQCNSNACKKIVEIAKNTNWVTNAYRVERVLESDADVIINLVANSKKQILESTDYLSKLNGVKHADVKVGRPMLQH